MSFREIDKEPLTAQVPPEIASAVRDLASKGRRSLSSVTTELLCKGLRRDPREFGIEPSGKGRRKPEPATTAP